MKNNFYAELLKFLGNVPLRFKIMGMVIFTAFLISTISIIQVYKTTEEQASSYLREISRSTANEMANLSEDYLLTNDIYKLDRIFQETVRLRPNLRYLFVVDKSGDVTASSFGNGFPKELLKVNRNVKKTKIDLIRTDEGKMLDAAAPIMHGDLGIIHAGVSFAKSTSNINKLIKSLIVTLLIITAVGVVLSLLLTYIITEPLKYLLDATKAIGKGNYAIKTLKSANDEIGELILAFNDMAHRLTKSEKERSERENQRKMLLKKIIDAQENERKRVARDLHDKVAQTLASLMIEFKIIENSKTINPANLTKKIKELRSTITQELDSLHTLCSDLRPSVIDDLGFVPAIEMFRDEFVKRYKIDCDLKINGDIDSHLDKTAKIAVYRIIQEALINVARHSSADKVNLTLSYCRNLLKCTIQDNGKGFDLSKKQDLTGIYGMRERAEMLNGRLSLHSEAGKGTTVLFEIPLKDIPPLWNSTKQSEIKK